ncbi:MAG: hypothetical protein ACQERD_07020 [Campylobacterota bacterium]
MLKLSSAIQKCTNVQWKSAPLSKTYLLENSINVWFDEKVEPFIVKLHIVNCRL